VSRLSDDYVAKIVAAIRGISVADFVPLHAPTFRGREEEYVMDCIRSTFVSSVGEYVSKFEKAVCDYTGAKFAVAMSSGTCALQLALEVAGVRHGDEVVVPALSFAATAASVVHAGAIPHFIDVDDQMWGMSSSFLESYLLSISSKRDGRMFNKITGRPISAIVPMHTFGHPVDMYPLLEFARSHGLVVIEDAAEALGSQYCGKFAGTLGDLGVFSFNGNKILTTGSGGMVVTDNEAMYRKARHVSTTAKVPHPYRFIHDEVGYNYRLSNLNAALGVAQMEYIEQSVERHRRLFTRYAADFSSLDWCTVREEPLNTRSNYWLQAIRLSVPNPEMIDLVVSGLNDCGIQSRPVWEPLPQLVPYQAMPCSSIDVAIRLAQSIVNIPSSIVVE
jgi:perosamine synthetase